MGQRQEHSPWLTVARDGNVTVRTSQVRLYLDAKLLGGTPGLASVHLPLYVELAEAQAKLTSISCQTRNDATVGLTVLPSVGNVAIASVDLSQLNNFSTPASLQSSTIASALFLNITGQAQVKLGGQTWKPLVFAPSQIAARAVQTVQTDDLVQGVASSLVSNMHLSANGYRPPLA
jgi:uncharacterized membrane protein